MDINNRQIYLEPAPAVNMNTVIRYVDVVKPWLSATEAGKVINQKSPFGWLKRFREYADKHPDVFYPYKPYTAAKGRDRSYSPIALGFFYEYCDVLEAGTRSIKLIDEEERLKKQYLVVDEGCL